MIINHYRVRLLCDVPDCNHEAEFCADTKEKCYALVRKSEWAIYTAQKLAKCPECKKALRPIRQKP